MDIVVTDLTRFANQEIVCIAGINPTTKECIRPLPYLAINECRRLNILPGSVLQGNFILQSANPPPHTEDRSYQGQLSVKRQCSAADFYSILQATESQDVEEGFEVDLIGGEKYISNSTPPVSLIITISINPHELNILPDSYNRGHIRAIFCDKAGFRFSYVSITDL